VELCDRSVAAEQRLGPVPGAHIGAWSSELRGTVAQAAGANEQAVDNFLDGARLALADDVPGPAAFCLAKAAIALSYMDPAVARRYATDGLALARQSGMPLAIAYNLVGLAQAIAPDDPDYARTLLFEAVQLATRLGYESPQELVGSVFCAARLEEWPTTLRIAGRALHHHLRSGALGLFYLAGILNVVARGLAERQPGPAAIVQGAVGTVIQRLSWPYTQRVTTASVAAFVAEVRRDTTQLLTVALGDSRLLELRAQGAAMDETQACTYARTHIDDYLTNSTRTENE
jgi:hypothetical protein